MIEYLYNAIKATPGEEIVICANITDDEGEAITDCESYFIIYKDDEEIFKMRGFYDGVCWNYIIPAATTAEYKGKYWYCICSNGTTLQFKQPIYFV